MKTRKFLSVALALVFGATSFAQKTVMVGGAAMYPSKNIIENAVNSKDHTTLVAAVKAAGCSTTKEKVLYSFAPTNAAFAKLPMGTVETLLKTRKYKNVTNDSYLPCCSRKMNAADIAKAIKAGNGKIH
jgi:uncharacterized surface protein with fasciclin (FAS1) repeats